MIELEYAGGARRLIPVEEADRIWKYGADRTAITLDGLDGVSWRKRALIIDQAMTEAAEDMTRLAKENAKRKAVKIDPDPVAVQRVFGRLSVLRDAGPGAGHHGGEGRSGVWQANGPVGRRRCRLWQDRGCAARSGAGRTGRQAGRHRRSDHGSRSPAL